MTYVRKSLPKKLAIVDEASCTGCMACVNTCPVDCIYEKDSDIYPQKLVTIDLDICIGCELCVHIKGKKTDPYELTVCPWDAIEMVDTNLVKRN